MKKVGMNLLKTQQSLLSVNGGEDSLKLRLDAAVKSVTLLWTGN